jgi:hypothetical protein
LADRKAAALRRERTKLFAAAYRTHFVSLGGVRYQLDGLNLKSAKERETEILAKVSFCL